MYPHLRTTPIAGAKLTSHLRALLLTFAIYLPPPTTLSSAANVSAESRATRVPQEILTDPVVEEIKSCCCFVGDALSVSNADFRAVTPLVSETSPEAEEPPPSDSAPSEPGQDSETSSQTDAGSDSSQEPVENYLQAICSVYKRHSTAADIHMRVTPPLSQQTGTGPGILIVPGWIRERAAEVLFEGGDVDESSVAEVILDSLLRVFPFSYTLALYIF